MFHPAFPEIDIPPHVFSFGFTTQNVYRHDVCPRLTRGNLSLWVDHVDPEQREGDGARFTLHPHDEDMQCSGEILEFETLPELVKQLSSMS